MINRKITATDRLFFLTDCYIMPDSAKSVEISSAVLIAPHGTGCLGKVILDALSDDPGTINRGCVALVGKRGKLYHFPYTGNTVRTGVYVEEYDTHSSYYYNLKGLLKKVTTCPVDKLIPMLDHENAEVRILVKARLKGDYP